MAINEVPLPTRPSLDLSRYELLDPKHVGHIRHIENLSRLPVGDWSHMHGRAPYQEDLEAYRYQLAYMAFALALAHYHRLPAAPCVFRETFDRLIKKMLHPDVWIYWRETSVGQGPWTLDAPRRSPETDPVAIDNIMYSAYLQVMVLMYRYLFNDDKYEHDDSISFKYRPVLYGTKDIATFSYNANTLNSKIYWNMVKSGYVGVACEPYCAYIICNQIPILGFRIHDFISGNDTASDVIASWKAAWNTLGGIKGADGRVNSFYQTDRRELIQVEGFSGQEGWLGAVLNSWNPEFLETEYDRIVSENVVPGPNGTAYAKSIPIPEELGMLNGANSDHGWMAVLASERGDDTLTQALLEYADRYKNPCWMNGGYFYPRADEMLDVDQNSSVVSVLEGNALLAYARLNVPGGLNKFYAGRWGSAHFREPCLARVSDNVNVFRAVFDAAEQTLIYTLAPRDGATGPSRVVLGNVAPSDVDWTLWQDGAKIACHQSVGAKSGRTHIEPTKEGVAVSVTLDRATTFVLTMER